MSRPSYPNSTASAAGATTVEFSQPIATYLENFLHFPVGAAVPAGYYDRGPSPGLGFTWIDGYYYPSGGHYAWRQGYWTRPPHRGAVWVAPRWERGHYHEGRWRR